MCPSLPNGIIKETTWNGGTGIAGSELHGIHLRLPGYDEHGPTLEIYSDTVQPDAEVPPVNRPGFAHIAFTVEDVSNARNQILNAGGSALGEIVTLHIATGEKVTWCYVRDPEGNIIELQSWN